MDARSAMLPDKRETARNAQDAAAVAAFPTSPPPDDGDVTCADIRGFRSGSAAPQLMKVSMRAAGAANLSGAYYVGYNAAASVWEEFAKVYDGKTVALSDTRGFGELLRDVAACYTHVSVVGTLSASTLTVEVEPVEASDA